jgi:hypothetical protein
MDPYQVPHATALRMALASPGRTGSLKVFFTVSEAQEAARPKLLVRVKGSGVDCVMSSGVGVDF